MGILLLQVHIIEHAEFNLRVGMVLNCWLTLFSLSYLSYLVSGSFEQAVSAALSVSDQIRNASLEDACDRVELLEMLESAGMVLVQALKELRR